MKFNQAIWDALCFAARMAHDYQCAKYIALAEQGLNEYAAACGGSCNKLDETKRAFAHDYEFVPNPD